MTDKTLPTPTAPAVLDLLPPPTPVEPVKPTPEQDEDFSIGLAYLYQDVYTGLGAVYLGQAPTPLADERAERRGKQLALVLRRLGWADDEIIAYLGLSAGLVSDFSVLMAEKKHIEANKAAAPAPVEAKPQ